MHGGRPSCQRLQVFLALLVMSSPPAGGQRARGAHRRAGRARRPSRLPAPAPTGVPRPRSGGSPSAPAPPRGCQVGPGGAARGRGRQQGAGRRGLRVQQRAQAHEVAGERAHVRLHSVQRAQDLRRRGARLCAAGATRASGSRARRAGLPMHTSMLEHTLIDPCKDTCKAVREKHRSAAIADSINTIQLH